MRGHILITTLILLTLISLSTLYLARESLWLHNMKALQRDALQLDMFIDEVLLKAEQLIQSLSMDIIPQAPSACQIKPCIIFAQEANFFLEQSIIDWQSQESLVIALPLSSTAMKAWVIIELLVEDKEDKQLTQFFRTTFLLQGHSQTQLRMQATWKKATLNGNIFGTSTSRLCLR